MAIDLTTLDVAFCGQPFVQVNPANTDLSTLDLAFLAAPFYVPIGISNYVDSISETGALTDSFTGSAGYSDSFVDTGTLTDSFPGSGTLTDHIGEVGALSDSLFGAVVTSGEVVTHDVFSIDYAFDGQPFVQTGISGTWTLDIAFQGQPFVIVEQSQVGRIQPMLAIVSWPQMNV